MTKTVCDKCKLEIKGSADGLFCAVVSGFGHHYDLCAKCFELAKAWLRVLPPVVK